MKTTKDRPSTGDSRQSRLDWEALRRFGDWWEANMTKQPKEPSPCKQKENRDVA